MDDVFGRFAEAELHLERPNNRDNVVLTPLESSTFVHLIDWHHRSVQIMINTNTVQGCMIEMQWNFVRDLKELLTAYDKRIEELLWYVKTVRT